MDTNSNRDYFPVVDSQVNWNEKLYLVSHIYQIRPTIFEAINYVGFLYGHIT